MSVYSLMLCLTSEDSKPFTNPVISDGIQLPSSHSSVKKSMLLFLAVICLISRKTDATDPNDRGGFLKCYETLRIIHKNQEKIADWDGPRKARLSVRRELRQSHAHTKKGPRQSVF